jgi:hypothetical protein
MSSSSKATVISAAQALVLAGVLEDGAIASVADRPMIAARLRAEAQAPTFDGLSDADLAELMTRLEQELVARGWRPERAWRKAGQPQQLEASNGTHPSSAHAPTPSEPPAGA